MLFFVLFLDTSGQTPSNPKNTKPVVAKEKPLQPEKIIPKNNTNETTKPKPELKTPEPTKNTPKKLTISSVKPDAIKEKPKPENNIESLLIEEKIDTTKSKKDTLNILVKKEKEKEEEDTVSINLILPEEISKLQKGKAYLIGKKLLTACSSSKIKEFTENDFSERILRKFSLDYLSNICINVNRRFGKFEELLFKEALRVEDHKITIYRFKAVYEKKFFVKELRVYMNDQNKITSLRSLPWKPEFKPRKKRKSRKQVIQSLLIRETDSLFKDSSKIKENLNIIQEKVDNNLIIE
jgi:hypothetical protein